MFDSYCRIHLTTKCRYDGSKVTAFRPVFKSPYMVQAQLTWTRASECWREIPRSGPKEASQSGMEVVSDATTQKTLVATTWPLVRIAGWTQLSSPTRRVQAASEQQFDFQRKLYELHGNVADWLNANECHGQVLGWCKSR